MGGGSMVTMLIGFFLAYALQSLYRIVKILYTDRKVRLERENVMQESTQSDINNHSVDD